MKKTLFFIFVLLLIGANLQSAAVYSVFGKIIDKKTKQPLPYVNIGLFNSDLGTISDSLGYYKIENLKGGIYRIQASYLGYNPVVTPEFMLGNQKTSINIELEESAISLGEVNVTAGPFRKQVESPLSVRVIGFTDIQRSAGSNRDISRVLQSFPGVASSPLGYRNDLIVRGGGPSENKFYLDGIEVPNINHFATQGASGGPVGILNPDLIEEVNFYSGVFPANKPNNLSSMLDFKIKDGSSTGYNFIAAVGSSEFAFTTDGHIKDKITYNASVRQSYLQLLFKGLNLPFLPTFTDAQFKVKYKPTAKDELMVLGLVGIDHLELNQDSAKMSDGNKYLVSSLPLIDQLSYTIGAVYKHTEGVHNQTITLSRSYLRNQNIKYQNNNPEEPKLLDLNSQEISHNFRFENTTRISSFKISFGVNADYIIYTNSTDRLFYINNQPLSVHYQTDLPLWKYGLFATGQYVSKNERLTASLGFRIDGNSFNPWMMNPLNQISPRASLAYEIFNNFYINASAGRYYQTPSLTALGYKDREGTDVNKGLKAMWNNQYNLGLEYKPTPYTRITVEGFYKTYGNALWSLADSIPLASKGNDYGVVGNEALSSAANGRAYGVEFLARWTGYKNLNFLVAYTFVRSQYTSPYQENYIPSSWDNQHLLTLTAGYEFPKGWVLGTKFRLVGGAPATPYDQEKSSLKLYWDTYQRAALDYSRYNTLRGPIFTQWDLRLDKTFFFKKWMMAVYIDVQNVLNTKYKDQDIYLSTGVVANPEAPISQQKYVMKTVERNGGTIVPGIGLIFQF